MRNSDIDIWENLAFVRSRTSFIPQHNSKTELFRRLLLNLKNKINLRKLIYKIQCTKMKAHVANTFSKKIKYTHSQNIQKLRFLYMHIIYISIHIFIETLILNVVLQS